MALELTQPLTKMSTRICPGDKGQAVHKADNLTAICVPTVYKILNISHPMGLQSLLQRYLTLVFFLHNST
jgi:hypothetical protein